MSIVWVWRLGDNPQELILSLHIVGSQDQAYPWAYVQVPPPTESSHQPWLWTLATAFVFSHHFRVSGSKGSRLSVPAHWLYWGVLLSTIGTKCWVMLRNQWTCLDGGKPFFRTLYAEWQKSDLSISLCQWREENTNFEQFHLCFISWGGCMCGLQVCVCMHHVCACALEGHQRASCILSWSTNTCCWAALDAGDLGPLEEHHHLLPPQPSLLPIISVVTSRLASITRNLGAGCHRLLYSVLPFGLSDRTLGVSNHSDH